MRGKKKTRLIACRLSRTGSCACQAEDSLCVEHLLNTCLAIQSRVVSFVVVFFLASRNQNFPLFTNETHPAATSSVLKGTRGGRSAQKGGSQQLHLVSLGWKGSELPFTSLGIPLPPPGSPEPQRGPGGAVPPPLGSPLVWLSISTCSSAGRW